MYGVWWAGRWGVSGRSWGREHLGQNILYKKVYNNFLLFKTPQEDKLLITTSISNWTQWEFYFISYNLFFLKKETQLGNFGVELEKVSMMKIIIYVHEISREI